MVVFIALVAAGFDFEQFRDDLQRELDRRRERQDGGGDDAVRTGLEQSRARLPPGPLASLVPRVTPDPFIKQYLMTAGPTPVPPAVSQAMAAPMLYHRAPAFDELYERVLSACRPCSPPPTPCSRSPPAGRARWSRPSPTSSGRARRRWRWPRASSASAGSGCARRTAPTSSRTSRAGARGWTRPTSTGCSSENAGVEVVFGTLSETSTGIVHDIQAIAEVVRRHGALLAVDAVSGLGRRAAAAGRVGRRRGRRRLAEGADDAAGPGVRVGLRARAGAARSARPRRPLLLRLGPDAPRARRRARARSRRRSRCSSASTSRSA